MVSCLMWYIVHYREAGPFSYPSEQSYSNMSKDNNYKCHTRVCDN